MSNLQVKVNADKTVSIILTGTQNSLYGVNLDELDKLPKALGTDEFCAAGFVKDVGWELRTVEFEKPSNESRRIKAKVELLSEFIAMQKKVNNIQFDNTMLIERQTRLEKQNEELRAKNNTSVPPPAPGIEHVGNTPVATTTAGQVALRKEDGTDAKTEFTDAYNSLVVGNFSHLTDVEKADPSTMQIKATFNTYYLTANGLKKVEVEFA